MKHTSNLAAVASLAGVDSSTASRVLNASDGARVSEATRQRILNAAATLNYRPNFVARGLRTAKTRSIALVVPEVNSPVFAEIIAGATEAVRVRDYTLLVGTQAEDAEGDPLYARLARANQVDGLIVAPRVRGAALSRGLAALTIPLVVAHTKVQGAPYCVTLDSFAATKTAIGHLIALGHRRIAYLARRATFYNDGRRLAGFRAAHRSAGLTADDALILHSPHTYADTYAQMATLLQTGAAPTAIFTVSLIATAGAMKALEDAGLRIPHDVSIIALYDHEFADALKPPVTTMRMPRADVGYVAARVLIDLLDGPPPPADLVLPPGELIVRESTAPPPA